MSVPDVSPIITHAKGKKVENENELLQLSKKRTEKPSHCIAKRPKLTNNVSVETQAYAEFMFRHKFSLLVVSPTECGKA